MKHTRLLLSLALMLVGQTLHAQQSEADRKALVALRAQAEASDARAQYALGAAFYAGLFGAATNYAEAVKWFRKAAEQNDAKAQFELASCYVNGEGVTKDFGEAAKWYRKAAEQSNVDAQNSLAWRLATSDNPAIRDGSNAVVFAEKAVTATSRSVPANLDTLAAAYAETGQFEKAVSTQREAIALLKTEEEKKDYTSRLKLYEAKEPYRAKN